MAMKVLCIHHRLGGYSSHHFNEAHGFIREFGRRGREFVLLVNAHAPPAIVAELNARAVLEDPTFRLEWCFEERSQRFREMLHRYADPLLKAGDCLLLTISTQLEAHALTRWLQDLPGRKKPWIVIVFLSDRWNRSGPDEYQRQITEFRTLEAAISSLAPDDANRIIFCTVTDLLAEELRELLGTDVSVVPMLLSQRDAEVRSAHAGSSRPRIAILGGTRREKGSHRIPEIVRACGSLVQVEFLVQLTNNTLTDEEVESLGRVAQEPNVTVIREAMTPADYDDALLGSDIALFPYEVIPYRKRTSGVFAEAVAFGKPVVATAGTWMAEQIEAGRAAGTIAEDLSPDSIARAVARCVGDIKPLQRSAAAVSPEWKKQNLAAFIDFMEAEIARRSRDERPRRRSFWPF